MAYNVAFNAGALFRDLNNRIKDAMADALELTAQNARNEWQEAALRAKGVSASYKDRYANSVQYTVDRNALTARIWSDDPMATPIETGIPARDLKTMLNTSLKTRVVKNGPHSGQRYMLIPFRSNSPGNTAHAPAMPQSVYNQAKQLEASSVKYISMRNNQLGVMGMSNAKGEYNSMAKRNMRVASRGYNWGGRLNGPDVPKRFKGMVRFDTSSGNKKDSTYLTFRCMGEWSPGWIQPARPGQFIVKGVAGHAQDVLQFNVSNAIASVAGR